MFFENVLVIYYKKCDGTQFLEVIFYLSRMRINSKTSSNDFFPTPFKSSLLDVFFCCNNYFLQKI